jgi:hypothetical protein
MSECYAQCVRRGDLRRFTSERGPLLVLASAVVVVVGGTRCTSGASEGAPCTEDQVGTTYAVLFASGDPCTEKGLTCPPPQDGGAMGCPASSLLCDGTKFVYQVGVGPGATCNQVGLVCRWADSECSTCICDGTTFHCQERCCVCADSGSK